MERVYSHFHPRGICHLGIGRELRISASQLRKKHPWVIKKKTHRVVYHLKKTPFSRA